MSPPVMPVAGRAMSPEPIHGFNGSLNRTRGDIPMISKREFKDALAHVLVMQLLIAASLVNRWVESE